MDFVSAMDSLVASLAKADSLREFRKAMMAMAEMTSREMLTANDDNLLHALRGQMRFCFELADRAAMALEAADADDKARAAEGIPDALRR